MIRTSALWMISLRLVWISLAVSVGSHCSGADTSGDRSVKVKHVSTARNYDVDRALVGALPFIDRTYQFHHLPQFLEGQVVVRTSMDDDYVSATDHLSLTLTQPCRIYVGIDQRGNSNPDWLTGWREDTAEIKAGDATYRLLHHRFVAGTVVLGGNDRKSTGACSNYIVIVAPETPGESLTDADFIHRVRPLLSSRCFCCHGPEAQEGGLRLDVRRRALLGGDSGLAIDPYESAASELIARVSAPEISRRMPPDADSLSDEEIDLLRRWIDTGAVWPDDFAGQEDPSDHWAFRPVRRPPVPTDGSVPFVRRPLDAFVLSELNRAGLKPSPPADKRTLIRRLCLDLLGLPPTPEEVQAFVDQESPEAYQELVDRFLQSSHFGERWGKHWLDMARYADSDGYENDRPRPHAWVYRDWVIQAINDDLPFDQFTIQQLAGDLLPQAGRGERIATAFHRNTLHNSAGGADPEEFRSKAVKDRTAVTGTIWMGLTWNCAECHTHKYDPIAHREYYQFYAFFNNSDHTQEGDVPILMSAQRSTRIHKRGNFLDPGPVVLPDGPAFLPAVKGRGPIADRLDLARWLVSADHPLTPRVLVNQVWQHLFGRGLVSTPENFGRKGAPPSHPELLDWLAAEFAGIPAATNPLGDEVPPGLASGIVPWSRKSLIREIVLSSTYQQVSSQPETPPEADPDNQLLWRQNRFRVEAEIVRDLTLAVSGLLDREKGGPSIQPPLPRGLSQLSELKNEQFQESKGSPYRRGVYVHMQRTFPNPMVASFDGPDGNQCMVSRDRSTTPMQALTLLNEPALDECAQAFGRRIQAASVTDSGKIDAGFAWSLSRTPSPAEQEIFFNLISSLRTKSASEADVWHGVARTLLNLDELITRE